MGLFVMIDGQLVQFTKTPTFVLEQTEETPKVRLEKPCCGGKIDKEVKAFREKQKRLRMERL